MQLRIIIIGKLRNKNLFSEFEDIRKRISYLQIIELKEIKDVNSFVVKKKEYELFKPYVNSSFYNVLLWEHGTEFDTVGFYEKFKKIEKPVQFFITGAFGPSREFLDVVDMKLSLSKMTFTHEMALILLIEQLYRVQCFKKNIPYTK